MNVWTEHMYVQAGGTTYVWRSEGDFYELILAFHLVKVEYLLFLPLPNLLQTR